MNALSATPITHSPAAPQGAAAAVHNLHSPAQSFAAKPHLAPLLPQLRSSAHFDHMGRGQQPVVRPVAGEVARSEEPLVIRHHAEVSVTPHSGKLLHLLVLVNLPKYLQEESILTPISEEKCDHGSKRDGRRKQSESSPRRIALPRHARMLAYDCAIYRCHVSSLQSLSPISSRLFGLPVHVSLT